MLRANQAVASTQDTTDKLLLESSYIPIQIGGTNHPAARQVRDACC